MFARFFTSQHKKPEETKLLDKASIQFSDTSLEDLEEDVVLDVKTRINNPLTRAKTIQQKLITLQREHEQKPPCSYTRLYQSKLWMIWDFTVSGITSGTLYGLTVVSKIVHDSKEKMHEINSDYYDTLHGNETCYEINNNTVINSLCQPQGHYVPFSLPQLSSLMSVISDIQGSMPTEDWQQMCQNLLKQYCDTLKDYDNYSADLIPISILLIVIAGYFAYRRYSDKPLLAANALKAEEISFLNHYNITITSKLTALEIAKKIDPLISRLECRLDKEPLSIVQSYLINSEHEDADSYNYIASMKAIG